MKRLNFCLRGFSLLELMMVVAIIGILAATSSRTYEKFVRKAKSVEMFGLHKHGSQAEILYYNEFGTFLFLKSTTSVTAKNSFLTGERDFLVDGGESVDMKNNWNQLRILPEGSTTNIYMLINQGKFYSDGTVAKATDTWDQGPISRPLWRSYEEFEIKASSDGALGICSGERSRVINPTDIGAESSPGRGYDWFYTMSVSKYDDSDDGCVSLIQLTTHDPSTGKYSSTSTIVLNDVQF